MTIGLCYLEQTKKVTGIHFMWFPVVMANGGGLRGGWIGWTKIKLLVGVSITSPGK